MDPYCLICNTKSNFFLKKDGYLEYLCPICNLSFVYPEPEQHFLNSEIYSEKSGYQANKKADLGNSKPVKKHRKVIEYLQGQKTGSFLDIGCSNGEMLYHAQRIGYKVQGLELNPRTAAMARANGFEVFNGLLENAGFGDHIFDYVYMGDVIEHVRDPKRLISEIRRILKPGGQLIILTPNMDCFWAHSTFLMYKLFRIPPSVITPPHHLFQFSHDNLRKLLEDNGYKYDLFWSVGAPRLMYELGCLHLLKRWKNNRKAGNFLFMVFSFALYTIVFGINRLVELLPVKRFSMAMVVRSS